MTYDKLHRRGAAQLRRDYKEDAGNKSYMLRLRLCFPRATLASHLQKAVKLGNLVESLFGYAEVL